MLAPTAKFIDHVLQPLSQSYQDYLQNSTPLVLVLDNMQIPNDAILVTIDVESLYPCQSVSILYTMKHYCAKPSARCTPLRT